MHFAGLLYKTVARLSESITRGLGGAFPAAFPGKVITWGLHEGAMCWADYLHRRFAAHVIDP